MSTFSRISKTLCLAVLLFSTNTYAVPFYGHPVPGEKDVIYKFGNASESALPKRMNVLVWNLHKGLNDTFATDFTELAHRKDVLITQEIQLDSNMKTLFANFPFSYFTTATSFFLGKNRYRTGVATISSVMPTEEDYVRTKTLEPVVNSPKVTLITRYPIATTGKNLTVVNIHGINFVDNYSYRSEIERIYEEIKDIPSPLVFTGDFNSWNDERFVILKDMTSKLKLRAARFFPDHRMRFNKHPLDHFYYTDDLRVIEAKVEDFYQGSDHRPLELIIEYSPLLKLVKNH